MSDRSITLKVEGMSCNGCAMNVQATLEEDTAGVSKAEVDLGKNQVTVTYDPDQVSLHAMEKAVKEAGYTLVLPE
ncbi:cation transporter [bacterium]|nr:cation transporter [bacterium]